MSTADGDCVRSAGWEADLGYVVYPHGKGATVATTDEDRDPHSCQVAQASIDSSLLAGAERTFACAVTDAQHLRLMIARHAIEHIDQFLRKGYFALLGLVIEDLGLGDQTRNEFQVKCCLALAGARSEVTYDIDILNAHRSDTSAGIIGGDITGIVGISELGHGDRHALSLEALPIELIELVGSGEFLARQGLSGAIFAAVACEGGRMDI